jgi:hypothetical protein
MRLFATPTFAAFISARTFVCNAEDELFVLAKTIGNQVLEGVEGRFCL